ncbi:MAG: ATP-binding cassette domain-containing protein [Anaerolineae bacterium]|nr:ATP-binding cassette domain-containing protein [Anaerolineae bacterium]
MTPLYELHGVSKAYEGRTVIDIDSLTVNQGEVLAVVGPSGVGKSTLLRMLNFLEFPDSGTLTHCGRIMRQGEVPLSVRREVTTVFQQPALLSTSVWRNVGYGLRLRGRRDSRAEIDSIIRRLGLGSMVRAQSRTLSAGEAQRVALARAAVLHPTVLLLDEPTANLDPYNVGLIEQVVREMNQQQGVTVVLVTHNVFQARRLADRVAFLLSGKIAECSDVRAFFESPQDPRTAAFVNGEMVY